MLTWRHASSASTDSGPKSTSASQGSPQCSGAVDDYGTVLERARMLWQVGDWAALEAIGRNLLDGHPQSAQLAVLVATAQRQLGRFDEAARNTALAEKWDCPRDVLASALVAGALNSLGRAHILRDRATKADTCFAKSLAVGLPGAEHPITIRMRADMQTQQLWCDRRESRWPPDAPFVSPNTLADTQDRRAAANANSTAAVARTVGNFAALDRLLESGLAARKCADDNFVQLVGEATACLARALGRMPADELTVSSVRTGRADLKLLHVRGDYIPEKVTREGKFYESEFLEVLEFFYEPGGLILDVGANIGNHTLYFTKVMGALVAAFEPAPHNVVALELNLQLNGVTSSVTTHRIALGSGDGQVELRMAIGQNFGTFSASPSSNPNRPKDDIQAAVDVPVRALDDVLNTEHTGAAVSIVKIDVEGMELAVLKGARTTLERWRPVVACECFSFAEFTRIEAFLTPMGYTPVVMSNFTPTFVFVSPRNAFHAARLADYLRQQALAAACKRAGFLKP